MYQVVFEPDDNGTLLVTCPELPEVTTWGEDEQDALRRAAAAIEEALAARIAHRETVPEPSTMPTPAVRRIRKPRRSTGLPVLSPLIEAKVALYRAAQLAGISKAELGRRLGWQGPQIDRLFDLRHRSKIDHVDQALRALGKRLSISVRDAA